MEKTTHQPRDTINLSRDESWPFPFSRQDWEQTPKAVQEFILNMVPVIKHLEKKIEEIESRLNQNSGNSNRPPSSDSPYDKKRRKKKRRKSGGKKGHKGHGQVMLEPSETVPVKPERCSCGNTDFPDTEPFYTHQKMELPEIQMEVTHFILHEGLCFGKK